MKTNTNLVFKQVQRGKKEIKPSNISKSKK